MKLRNLLYTLVAAVAMWSLSLSGGSTVDAQNPLTCPGEISGKTAATNDVNAGQIDFDGENGGADLSIIGGGVGTAPGSLEQAACATALDLNDEAKIEEYAWNDNAGFINFSNCSWCDVVIEESVGGTRQVSGTAWNPLFGYLYFNDANTGDAINYGATLQQSGDDWVFANNSWVWTDAKIWVNMAGVTVELLEPADLDDDLVCDPALDPSCIPEDPDFCDGKPWMCIEIVPEGSLNLQQDELLGYGVDQGMAIADGESGYEVLVYLRDENGDPLVGSDEFDLDTFSMDILWKDTVKADQLSGESGSFNALEQPFQSGGGVVYKPVTITYDDLDEIEPGVYEIDKGTIRSVAPTSNMNVSKVESVPEGSAYLVKNGTFLSPLANGNDIWTDDIEMNELILREATFELFDINGDPAVDSGGDPVNETVLYANGVPNLALKFRPPVEVHSLYANNRQDIIEGYRNIPVNIRMQAREIGDPQFASGPTIAAFLDYAETEAQGECADANFDMEFMDSGDDEKSFSFGQLVQPKDFQIVASLPDEESLCSYAEGPTLYTEIDYTMKVKPKQGGNTNVEVVYYGNKLPKIGGGKVANPQIYVSGTVKGNTAFSPSSSVDAVTAQSNANNSIIRDTIYENLQIYSEGEIQGNTKACEVVGFGSGGSVAVGDCVDDDYMVVNVDGEYIFYAKDDVYLNLSSGAWEGKWVVVSDGGNIFFDSDIYNGTYSNLNHLAVVGLRAPADDPGESGNAYIHPDVKNLQISIVLDGTLRSYFGDKGAIDDNGVPEGDFDKLVDELQNQLLIEGNVFARNTLGGFDLDKDEDVGYKLRGSGEIVESGNIDAELAYEIMSEDLHYLRLFKLEVAVNPQNGLPIDQACGMALSSDDIQAIATDEEVVNDENGKTCDGINSLYPWDETKCPSAFFQCGDLVVNAGDTRRAKDVLANFPNQPNLPVYVIYRKVPDSVIFSQRGALVF